MTMQVSADCNVQLVVNGQAITNSYALKAGNIWSVQSRFLANNERLSLVISSGSAKVEIAYKPGIHPDELMNLENRFYSPSAGGVFVGIVGTSNGGTGQDLSGTGCATCFLAQDAAHVVSVRSIIAADVPNLDASKITSGVLPPARGGVVTAVTPDQGYFVSTNLSLASLASSSQAIAAANQVRASLFHLPFRTTISKVTITVGAAGGAGALVATGLYSADGLTKLLDSGTFDGNTVSTQTNAIVPVSLDDGFYFFVQTANVLATLTCQAVNINSGTAAVMNNQVTKKIGLCANASVAGVLPVSLGAITATGYQMLLACFDP